MFLDLFFLLMMRLFIYFWFNVKNVVELYCFPPFQVYSFINFWQLKNDNLYKFLPKLLSSVLLFLLCSFGLLMH